MNDWFAPASKHRGLTQEVIVERVFKIVTEQLQLDDPVSRTTRLVDDLGADSLDVVELVMETEDQFDIELPMSFTPVRVEDIIKAVKEITDGD